MGNWRAVMPVGTAKSTANSTATAAPRARLLLRAMDDMIGSRLVIERERSARCDRRTLKYRKCNSAAAMLTAPHTLHTNYYLYFPIFSVAICRWLVLLLTFRLGAKPRTN